MKLQWLSGLCAVGAMTLLTVPALAQPALGSSTNPYAIPPRLQPGLVPSADLYGVLTRHTSAPFLVQYPSNQLLEQGCCSSRAFTGGNTFETTIFRDRPSWLLPSLPTPPVSVQIQTNYRDIFITAPSNGFSGNPAAPWLTPSGRGF
jgi:hypothetical protein